MVEAFYQASYCSPFCLLNLRQSLNDLHEGVIEESLLGLRELQKWL